MQATQNIFRTYSFVLVGEKEAMTHAKVGMHDTLITFLIELIVTSFL